MCTISALRLTGARILRDGTLTQRSLAIRDGRICRGPLPAVDLSGYLILPGIVDLGWRGFERLLARQGPDAALPAIDAEAAAAGITTAYLAQGWSCEGGLRSPDAAEAMLAALARYRGQALGDLRMMIVAKTHLTEQAPRLLAAVARHRVGYVCFDDRLAPGCGCDGAGGGDAQCAATPEGAAPQCAAQPPTLPAAMANRAAVPRSLCRLADGFDQLGVAYGSLGDTGGEMRERFSMIGARIAQCPAAHSAAAAAHAMGGAVLVSATDLCAQRPHPGAVVAQGIVAHGLCDALVSGDQAGALARAGLALGEQIGLAQAWAMISTRPAQILGFADRGTLDVGARADMVVVHEDSGRIEATICAGRITYLAGGAAARLIAALNDADARQCRQNASRIAAE